MASFFGEILEPTSRAIFDDFSDEEDEIEPIELQFSWSRGNVVPEVLDAIYIYCGKLSLVFAEAYLLSDAADPDGEITVVQKNEESSGDNDDRVNYKKKFMPCRIYYNNSVMTCLVSPTYSSDLAYQFVDCIVPWLRIAKRVLIFTNEFCSNYKSAGVVSDLPPAFVRELKTSHGSDDYTVDKLPVPNIVAGIPAAIASWCQIFEKDASLFVCYTDQEKLDSVTAKPYLSVVKKLNPELIKNENPNLKKKRFYSNPDFIGGSSNIYI